jgi:hypothetical protein
VLSVPALSTAVLHGKLLAAVLALSVAANCHNERRVAVALLLDASGGPLRTLLDAAMCVAVQGELPQLDADGDGDTPGASAAVDDASPAFADMGAACAVDDVDRALVGSGVLRRLVRARDADSGDEPWWSFRGVASSLLHRVAATLPTRFVEWWSQLPRGASMELEEYVAKVVSPRLFRSQMSLIAQSRARGQWDARCVCFASFVVSDLVNLCLSVIVSTLVVPHSLPHCMPPSLAAWQRCVSMFLVSHVVVV